MAVAEADAIFMAVTCEVQKTLIGIDTRYVEEIVKIPVLTPVHGAAAYVLGIVNMRGRIVTVIDLAKKMNLKAGANADEARIIVTHFLGESIGLLVPKLADVVQVEAKNVKAISGEFQGGKADNFLGIYEQNGQLVALLDPEMALRPE